MIINLRIGLAIFIIAVGFIGCASHQHKKVVATSLIQDQTDAPESQLLDVGIQIFDSGLADNGKSEHGGIAPEVRKAESRYIPVHLKKTLQQSGQWGAVRLIPSLTYACDVTVKGQIEESDGESLTVKIDVIDASGRVWLRKEYEAQISERDYLKQQDLEVEPFQNLYNTIANDMLVVKSTLKPDDISAIRKISELRFATELAPDVFQDYLGTGQDGRFWINRLPAENDPMVDRIKKVRKREHMFIDILKPDLVLVLINGLPL